MTDTRRLNFGADLPRLLGPDANPREVRKGQWFARCPFHDDSTASLSITYRSDRGWVWNCFGCGESGDAISFVMRLHEVSFREACAILEGVTAHYVAPPRLLSALKPFVLVCDKCRDEWIGVDVKDLVWLAGKWEIAPDAIGAVGPRCLQRMQLREI